MRNITTEDWKQVFELLDTALDMPVSERKSWLESLEKSRPNLHPAMRDLLERQATQATGDFLEQLPQFTHVDALPRLGAPTAGSLIGPWRLLREIGTGGMGSVWLAERADGTIKRQVALKLPHVTWSGRLAEQMVRERDILAALEHPNIARLYDAGVDMAGRPFLAMEYVEGKPIDQYAREHVLSVDDCLRLILEVAKAVAHAHARLIVHRDLKPSNVLVTADGSVRLLDFGIARLLQPGSTDTRLTRTALQALTPDYASPEQIRGETIGTPTDVYSLAVLAFELLVGARPDRRNAARSAPTLASEAAPDRQRARALRGDLDAILNRALKPDPRERYATVDAFAQDIERHRRGDPVEARPDSSAYRLARFLSRHRTGAIATFAVLIAILAGASVALWQARIARAEAQRAEVINKFILSLFESARPTGGGGSELRVTELLAQALPRIESELSSQPQRQLELYTTVGEGLRELNAYPQSIQAYDRATAVARREHLESIDPAILARLGKADSLVAIDDLGGAAALLDKVDLALRGRPPGLIQARASMVRSYLLLNQREPEKAVAAAKAGVSLFGDVAGKTSVTYLEAMLELVRAQYHADQCEDAVPQIDYALRELPRTLGTVNHPDIMLFRGVRARCLKDLRRYDEALVEFERNDAPVRAAFGAGSKDYAVELLEHGDAERNAGRSAEAAAHARSALGILAANDVHGYSVVGGHAALVLALVQGRYLDEAMPAIRAYHEAAVATFGPDDRETMISNIYEALVNGMRGEMSRGIARLDELVRAMPPQGESYRARSLSLRARLRSLNGQNREAIQALDECIPALEARGTPDEVWLAVARGTRGTAQVALDQAATALPLLERALADHSRLIGRPTPDRADMWVGLARAHLALGHSAPALQYARAADDFWIRRDPRSRWAGEAAYWNGRAQLDSGQRVAARATLERAARVLAASPIPGDGALTADARARARTINGP